MACSWDGHTYLVNLNKEVVRFRFRESVAAFCAGLYTLVPIFTSVYFKTTD